jgi:hypothetical protein
LVCAFLQTDTSARDYLDTLGASAANYNPFNLLVFDGTHLPGLESRHAKVMAMQPGIGAVSNAGSLSPWPKLSSLSSSLQTLHEQEAPSDAQLLALLHTTTLAADVDLKIARELPAFSDAPNSRYHCTKHFLTQLNPFLMKATHFTDHIRDHMAINFTRSNVLEVQGGLLTGHRVHQPWGDICDGAEKRSMLLQLCDPLRINPKQTIAMGDGANDLPMMGVAGLDRLLTLFQS